MWLIYYNTDISALNQWVVTICKEIGLFFGKNGTAHLDGIFWKKKSKEGITLSQFYQNDRNFLYHLFGLPVPGFMSREIEKFTGILLLIQLNPSPNWVLFFGAKNSTQCLLLLLLHMYMCFYTLIMWLPFQPTTEPKVDNIRMAGYMEKLPVKSNQKKVHTKMKNPAMSIVHWSSGPVPRLITDPSLQGTSFDIFTRRDVYTLMTEIPNWWRKSMFT